jgi:RNA methyltransferase, TrmH family
MITKLQVKYIQSLGQKKFRDQEAVFVAEAPKIINELLTASPASLRTLYATAGWLEKHTDMLPALHAANIVIIKEQELERISFLQTPNEVLGIFAKPSVAAPLFNNCVSLMLDGIQDPGNMGTLIRIADWFGVRNIICSNDCADAFAPKVVQSTMGSILRVQLSYTDLLQWTASFPGLVLYAATLNGSPLHSMHPLQEGVIVIGNESKGIRPALLEQCKQRITIPRTGHAESLNAAVAAGIILSRIIPSQ